MKDFERSRHAGDFEDLTDGVQPGRRHGDQLLEMLLHKVTGMESRIGDRFALELDSFKKDIRLELQEELKRLVPDGDIEKHRRQHEEENQSSARWANFRFALFEHLAKAGAIGIAVYIGMAVWDYFKRGTNS